MRKIDKFAFHMIFSWFIRVHPPGIYILKITIVMIAENFNSKSVQSHYESSRKQAIAYLFTTGAKALVITEQKSTASDAFIGANMEAELKKEIINDEKVRLIKRRLAENYSIQVFKYSRTGKQRPISMKVKHDSHTHMFFSWKSKNNIKKHFVFGKLATVEPLVTKPVESVTSYYANDKTPSTQHCMQPPAALEQMTLPFLRFRNSDRMLDIRFNSIYEMEACLEMLGLSPAAVWTQLAAPHPVPHKSNNNNSNSDPSPSRSSKS